MENNVKKEITLNDIAELIKVSANETTKSLEAKITETKKALEIKIDSSAEQVATMTQKQFLELGKKIGNMESDIKEIKGDVDEIKTNLNKKVNIFKHNDLEYRVEKLEDKVGVTFKKNLAAA